MTLTPETLAEGERSDAATRFFQCWRVRPRGESAWLYLEPKGLADLADHLADIEPGDTYDLEMFFATREEIDAWGEFDGW